MNEAQAFSDLTITEKLDTEFDKQEFRKVLSSSFDFKADNHTRQNWQSNLRQKTSGCGNYEQITCCDKMEETATEADLGPNKRLQVTKGSRNHGEMKSFVTVHINKQDEDE